MHDSNLHRSNPIPNSLFQEPFSSKGNETTVSAKSSRIRVLVLSKELQRGGGVVNFIGTLFTRAPDTLELEHFRVGSPNSRSSRIIGLYAPIVDNVRLFVRLIRSEVDCVHMNPSMNWRSFVRDSVLLMTARLAGANNIVIFFHGWDEKFVQRIHQKTIYRYFLQKTFGNTSIIIVLAADFKKQLETLGLRSELIVVGTTMFDGDIFDGVQRQEKKSSTQIVFLSRFIKEKGVFQLLESFRYVQERFPEARLALAGDGPARGRMEEYVRAHDMEGSVDFVGFLTGVEKAQILEHSCIFVFPTSHPEGCPVVLLEAMAAGLPIVTTAVGGIGDIFVDGKNGILLKSLSPTEIAKVIVELLQNPGWRLEIGQRNRKMAWEHFESQIVARQLESVYRAASSVVARG